MSKGKKIGLGILVFIVVVVVALAVIIPLLIDIDRYRPQVIAHIQEATGKPAEIGKLSLTVFPKLSIRVDEFALGNPPGFPKGYLVKTPRIYVEVDRDALWEHKVIILALEVDKPVIRLYSDARGKWNFENPPAPRTESKPASSDPSSFTLGTVARVTAKDADVAAANLSSSGRAQPNFFEGGGITIDLHDVDINAFISEKAAASQTQPPENFALRLFAPTPLYAATAGKPAAEGTLEADALSFGAYKATSVKTKLRLFPKQVFLDDLKFNLYGGHAAGNISLNLAGQSPRYTLNARLNGVDMQKLLDSFPDGRGQMTGKMDGDIKLAGTVVSSPDPLAGIRGSGKVNIKDGKLPKLQINRNLMSIAKLGQLGAASGDPSAFESISSDFNIAEGKISSEKISVVGTGMNIDGLGALTLAGEGSLAYDGIAKLAAAQNPLTNLMGGLTGATYEEGKLVFPFAVGGTLSNPQFKLKSLGSKQQLTGIQSLLGGQQQTTTQDGQTTQEPQTPADLVQGLSGLFKKKNPAQDTTTPPK
ncbi:MAG: AsmA family protein [Acidobacteria bacterium]|nr:AsmA family protein [Acidobacteriota bacterium]